MHCPDFTADHCMPQHILFLSIITQKLFGFGSLILAHKCIWMTYGINLIFSILILFKFNQMVVLIEKKFNIFFVKSTPYEVPDTSLAVCCHLCTSRICLGVCVYNIVYRIQKVQYIDFVQVLPAKGLELMKNGKLFRQHLVLPIIRYCFCMILTHVLPHIHNNKTLTGATVFLHLHCLPGDCKWEESVESDRHCLHFNKS